MAGTAQRRRGIKLYPGSHGVETGTLDFRGEAKIDPVTKEHLGELQAEGWGSGVLSTTLFCQSEEEGGFSMILVWAKPNYPLPRHNHFSDCIYFVVSGSATMGNRTLRPGDAFYAPNGANYQYTAGPDGMEVLEVRRGVTQIGTEIAAEPPAVWERWKELIVANREQWEQMTVPPTLAANRAAE
jgi:mannose-6-phosphate isomerase-like protein (cupin superfamily)